MVERKERTSNLTGKKLKYCNRLKLMNNASNNCTENKSANLTNRRDSKFLFDWSESLSAEKLVRHKSVNLHQHRSYRCALPVVLMQIE